MKEMIVNPVKHHPSLREVLASYTFPNEEMPIKGGWGYFKEDAIIIDKNDPMVPKGSPFDGVGLEYILVEKRNVLEFDYLQDEKNTYRSIHWKTIHQELVQDEDRFFDKLTVEITALFFEAWKSRRKEWKENGHMPDFDKERFMARNVELSQYCIREFWFDISSFFGQ